jgi:hypothetical protein
MSYYMGTQARPIKSGSVESVRPYEENGGQKNGNFGLEHDEVVDRFEQIFRP